MAYHFDCISGLEAPQIYYVFSENWKVSCKCKYESLWHTTVTKDRKENTNIFKTYFEEIQEKVAETWRIPPEVVEEYKMIANFKAS
jgi:hypothetical protein